MDETKQFDVPEVLAALEAAVAKRGEDYVYLNEEGNRNTCSYVHYAGTPGAQPGCIAGQVYFDLTGKLVPADLEIALLGIDDDGFRVPRDEWIADGTFTPNAIRILGKAQGHQDSGKPWGVALSEARRAAADLE